MIMKNIKAIAKGFGGLFAAWIILELMFAFGLGSAVYDKAQTLFVNETVIKTTEDCALVVGTNGGFEICPQ